jgi:hypothetical protein
LDDSCLTDAESSTCDVPDDEIDDDALQPSTPALCTKCQSISLDDMITQGAKNMQVGKYKDKLGYRLHDSLYDLGNSALTGCRLCQIILIEAKRYLQPPETETYRNIVAGLYDNNGLSDLPVFIRLSTKSIHFCGTFDVHIPLGDLDSTTIASLEIEAKDQGEVLRDDVSHYVCINHKQ